ncbi:hypothetical protein FHS85_002274 [Rhodoligotrophos appendicifer]|uniref:DUF6644 family protein n=1 Tax=Rhodoligotrophos appendicifer TaxID=987056 RepID=UPI001185DB90|nr:DUF6644 family protein [Rhodoligotrophos appendicifer]
MSVVEWIGNWPGALLLRRSGTAYLFVNATHILGIALLIGAILPLDLRLAGFFRSVPVQVLAPFLSRMAAFGLCLAVLTGLWLFSVKPAEYLSNPAFLVKVVIIAAALVIVALQHYGHQYRRALAGGEIELRVRVLAVLSGVAWLLVLLAGRWIGFL